MVVSRLKRRQLRKTVITLLGSQEYEFQPRLRAAIKKNYTNIEETKVDSAIETLLLELEESGIIQLKPDDLIALTESGINEHKLLMKEQRQKHRNKSRKSALKMKILVTEKKKKESRDVHERLKKQLGRLAVLLGKTWKQEYQLVKDGPVILDMVWYAKPSQLEISHAFEVQHRGEWKNAIGNLEAVNRRYPKCKLFVLVFNEKQINPIHNLLGTQMNTCIQIIKVSQLQKWLDLLEQIPEKSRLQFIYTVDDILNSGII